jgi:type IV secretion system protein TrbL
VLLLLALVAVNMLILLVSAWVLLYGGVFFLGFGGARWTSNMAINYYKTVLGLAASLFAMVLVIGVATSIIDEYYRAMGPDIQLKELTVVMIVAFIMAMLIKSIPPLISGIITGASIGQGGTMGFGAGAIVGVGAMGASAIAMGGAAIAAGTASAAGGAQALMAAYTKASAASSGGIGSHGMGDMMGGAAIAAANLGGSSSGGGSVFAGMDSASSSGSGFSGSRSRLDGGFGSSASESGSSTEKGKDSSESGTTPDAKGKADAAGKPTGSDANGGGPGNGLAPGEQRATGSMLGRAASIAAGTAGNLALGTWDMAKAKASNMRESAFDRIGETTGGKIATAIRARDAQAPASVSAAPADMAFNGNELSAGKAQEEPSAASEVADFVNRSSKTS